MAKRLHPRRSGGMRSKETGRPSIHTAKNCHKATGQPITAMPMLLVSFNVKLKQQRTHGRALETRQFSTQFKPIITTYDHNIQLPYAKEDIATPAGRCIDLDRSHRGFTHPQLVNGLLTVSSGEVQHVTNSLRLKETDPVAGNNLNLG